MNNRVFDNSLDAEFENQLLADWSDQLLANLRDENNFYSQFVGTRDDDRLKKIVDLTISLKAKEFPSSPTGLVFAGFGELSVYPEIHISKQTGFVAHRFILSEQKSVLISQHNNSYISGFAQSSMTETFMVGFDAQVYETIRLAQEQSFPDVLTPFAQALGAAIEETDDGPTLVGSDGATVLDANQFRVLVHSSFEPVGDMILDTSRRQHGEPLDRVISMLPVEEMAELAATMVDLQSLKEKVTRPSETVGGPVDVAIITKNEGLVWKKRKHFFDADINRRYLHRLQSSD